MSHMINFISYLAVIISILQTTEGTRVYEHVKFSVINRASKTIEGKRFQKLNITKLCEEAMVDATILTWKIFNQKTKGERKRTKKITTIFMDFREAPSWQNDEIQIPSSYFNRYPDDDDLKKIIKGDIYELTVSSWQAWPLSGPEALITGIGSFVRIKVELVPDYYSKKGGGETWNESNSVTGWFLEYCQDTITDEDGGFMAKLNRNLAVNKYSESDMFELFGNKTIDQKWKEYETAFGGT